MKPQPAAANGARRRLPRKPGDPFLTELGTRARRLRARSGLTRRQLAKEADVSERHLANLETGTGNPSVQILRQVARALNCSVAELVGDESDESADWLLIRDLLRGRSTKELADARRALTDHFGLTGSSARRGDRIALIGLRGAGKSTLGRMLAEELHYPFVEVNREVERLAGCSPQEIHGLYGASAYRRYERQALEEVIARNPRRRHRHPGGFGLRADHLQPVAAELPDDLAEGGAGRAHEPGGRPGRCPPHGGQPAGHGRSAPHSRRACPFLCEGRPHVRHERQVARRELQAAEGPGFGPTLIFRMPSAPAAPDPEFPTGRNQRASGSFTRCSTRPNRSLCRVVRPM